MLASLLWAWGARRFAEASAAPCVQGWLLSLRAVAFAVSVVAVMTAPLDPGTAQTAQLDEAAALNAKARQYYREGKYGEALQALERVLAIREQALGPDHPDVATSLNNLALLYDTQGRYAEAEPLYKRALAIHERALGPDHLDVATNLNNLAELYRAQGRYAEAEPLHKRALAIWEKSLGPNHPDVARSLNNLASLYNAQGRYADAEPLFKRGLAIFEKVLGPDHPDVATDLNNLATLYHTQGRYADALPLYRRALAIYEKAEGPDHPDVALSLNNVAQLYYAQGRYAEAEPFLKRTLVIYEKALGPDHPSVALSLNNLAELYRAAGRYADAEPLHKRALAIREKALGPDHRDVAASLNNLAEVYYVQGRYAEAEPLYQRALAILEKALGPDHPDVATSLNNLALLYGAQRQYAESEVRYRRALAIIEKALGPDHAYIATNLDNLAQLYTAQGQSTSAEPLYQRALAVREKALGPDHPDVALSLNNLAELCVAQGRYAEAEPLYERAQAILEKALGPDHPDVAASLGNLAELYRAKGRSGEALAAMRHSVAILAARGERGEAERSLGGISEQRSNRGYFLGLVRLLVTAPTAEGEPAGAIADEAFRTAQLTGSLDTALVVAGTAARFAAGSGTLAGLARQRQDLQVRWRGLDAALVTAVSLPAERRNAQTEDALRRDLAAADEQLSALDARLRAEFPRYAELAGAQPLPLAEVQKLLAPDEALVMWAVGAAESYLFALRRDRSLFQRVPVTAAELKTAVALLRQGLVPEAEIRSTADLPPFDTTKAYELYRTLLGPAEELLADVRHVIVVPDGALQSLPVGVLVTERPSGPITDFGGYASVPWLARRYAVTVLPAVSSLRALRVFAARARAAAPFAGFGDPAFEGEGSARGVRLAHLFRGAAGVVDEVRKLPRLPDTAAELRAQAAALHAPESSIHLGIHASVSEVQHTDLGDTRVIAFATHGLVAGDLPKLAEPALALTPPASATPDDDGLLTASRIAQLKLNADWVVLSACNTAASDGSPGAEGLSGLAKAFFYAGARSLLVSHWAVDSAATVGLTTGAFRALEADPAISRAEALRRSMLAMIDEAGKQPGTAHQAHPMFWAPFVVVGD